MKLDKYDLAIKRLREKVAAMKCSDLIKELEAMGFICKKRNSGNHYTYRHSEFTHIIGDFDGGHGSNPQLKKCYVDNARKVIENLQSVVYIEIENISSQSKRLK